ncbi:MAG: hypothetical protein QG583_161 [Patescibacteria group bacterium]|nr:hypothetical protein [Patescibacteria group bacterium]
MYDIIIDGPDSSEEKGPDDWKDNEGDVFFEDLVDVSQPPKEKPPRHDLNDK